MFLICNTPRVIPNLFEVLLKQLVPFTFVLVLRGKWASGFYHISSYSQKQSKDMRRRDEIIKTVASYFLAQAFASRQFML